MATKTIDDLVRIAAAGGGMHVAARMRTDDLARIASAAAASSNRGARIIVTGRSAKSTDDLVRIAAAGKGCVVFDLL